MVFRQLFDPESGTLSYLVADDETRKAALIDPVLASVERDLALVKELGLTLEIVLETHVHADHVTSASVLRERSGARMVVGAAGPRCADLQVGDGAILPLGRLAFRVLATPGHSEDGVSLLLVNRDRLEQPGACVFTGDTLLVRGCGRTDLPGGDAGRLYDSITRVLFALPDDTLVFPAHDYEGNRITSIGEERRLNPRLAGRSRKDFIALMSARRSPEPRLLQRALAANRACGNEAVASPPGDGERGAR